MTFYNDGSADSSITYYSYVGSNEPYLGYKYLYPREFSEGADYEQFFEYYAPETGWLPNSHTLVYRNEEEVDTLTREFAYNTELMEYLLSYERVYQYGEDYSLSEYRYFQNGEVSNLSRSEQTSEFILNENYNYVMGEISAGAREYTRLREDGGYEYIVTKRWSLYTLMMQNEDSTHYNYLDGNTRIEAEGYFWDDSVWVYDQLYTSFQHETEEFGFLVDSILVYDVDWNEETEQREVGEPYIKSFMTYDEAGNQIEVRNYQAVMDSLELFGIVKRKYKVINGYQNNYFTEVFTRDYSTGGIYRSSMSETFYNGNTYLGNKYFNFNALGDTTYGYQTQYEDLPDGNQAIVQFTWDYNSQSLLLSNFRINQRTIKGDDGKLYYQNASVQILPTGEYAVNRSMNGYTSYPGILSDGPVPAIMGDTVSLYLSARNPDMSIPEISIENMPATATFNPETNHFFWVVDEENPDPMTYKATKNGSMSVTVDVYFQSDQFTIPTEEESSPYSFELMQNYPNPFNPATVISYQLPVNSLVSLKVYDLVGREVATLVDTKMAAGNHQVNFDASQLSSGMYIYRLQAGNKVQTRKMMLIK